LLLLFAISVVTAPAVAIAVAAGAALLVLWPLLWLLLSLWHWWLVSGGWCCHLRWWVGGGCTLMGGWWVVGGWWVGGGWGPR